MDKEKTRNREVITTDERVDIPISPDVSASLNSESIPERESDTERREAKEKEKKKLERKRDNSILSPEPVSEQEEPREEGTSKAKSKKKAIQFTNKQQRNHISESEKAFIHSKQAHIQAARHVQNKLSRFSHKIGALLLAEPSAPNTTSLQLTHRPGPRRPSWGRQNLLLSAQPEAQTNKTKWQTLPPEILAMIFSQRGLLLRAKNKTPKLLIAVRPHEVLYKIALPIYLRINLFTMTVKRGEEDEKFGGPKGGVIAVPCSLATLRQIRRLKLFLPAPIYAPLNQITPQTLPHLENLILSSPTFSAILILLHPILYLAPFETLKSLTIELLYVTPGDARRGHSWDMLSLDMRKQKDLILRKVNSKLGEPTRFAQHCSRPRKREVWVWIATDLKSGFGLRPDTGDDNKFSLRSRRGRHIKFLDDDGLATVN